MSETLVACAQLALDVEAPEANREAATAAIRAAAEQGAQVIVLPELTPSGYALADAEEARRRAEPVAGPTVSGWAALAAELGVVVVGGFCELGDDGRVCNAAVLVDPSGVRAVYRKVHLWDREPELFAAGDAPPPVVETAFGRIGVVVCYDLEFPEWMRTVALAGADLVCAPVNWPRFPAPEGERPMEVVRVQAQAAFNRIFVAACDRSGGERGVDWVGGSTVVDPDGWPLTAPLGTGPGLALARCDLSRARDKRVGDRNDVHRDRRPELYGRTVEPDGVPAPAAPREARPAAVDPEPSADSAASSSSRPARSRSSLVAPVTEPYLAAAVQAAPVFLDKAGCLARALEQIKIAADAGARLVAFPESWMAGYPAWINGAAGWEDPRAKRLFARFQRESVDVPGPEVDALCRAAARHRVNVVMGINERDTRFSRGTIYNSQLLISDRGELLGVHRKLVPTHAERIVWGAGDGSTLHVEDTSVGRLGALICWEHWMPLTRFAMHAQGEQVHVAGWPDVAEDHQLASRHYAFEGRCFVVCAGTYLTTDHLPDDFEMPEAMAEAGEFGQDAGVIFPGGSGIIGPDGRWISGPVFDEETIVYGEIDLSRIGGEQQSLDTAGHYNRPDVFRLSVDTSRRDQIEWGR